VGDLQNECTVDHESHVLRICMSCGPQKHFRKVLGSHNSTVWGNCGGTGSVVYGCCTLMPSVQLLCKSRLFPAAPMTPPCHIHAFGAIVIMLWLTRGHVSANRRRHFRPPPVRHPAVSPSFSACFGDQLNNSINEMMEAPD
jgi:hypothetical protein